MKSCTPHLVCPHARKSLTGHIHAEPYAYTPACLNPGAQVLEASFLAVSKLQERSLTINSYTLKKLALKVREGKRWFILNHMAKIMALTPILNPISLCINPVSMSLSRYRSDSLSIIDVRFPTSPLASLTEKPFSKFYVLLHSSIKFCTTSPTCPHIYVHMYVCL